jgi:hypothetical protein
LVQQGSEFDAMGAERQKLSAKLGRRPKEVMDSPTQDEVEAALSALIESVIPRKPPSPVRPKSTRKTPRTPEVRRP